MELILQNRWKAEDKYLVYYGLRNGSDLFKNKIKISSKLRKTLSDLQEVNNFTREIKRLYKNKILVEKKDYIKTPDSFEEAIFCKKCAMNDFLVPGVVFDDEGLCPICSSKINDKLKSILPTVTEIPKSKKSGYDVAVFYTGGKDSTFLLYYLAKILNLRVLSLTWNIPYMSDTALLSIENAKKCFPEVDFIIEKFDDDKLKRIYSKFMELQNNTCMCPTLAYFLFYEKLMNERVPYLILGNEPAQMKNLYYNHFAPKIAYTSSDSTLLNILINIPRILTFKKPFRKGQFQMLQMVKQMAYGDNKFKNIAGYGNLLTSSVCKAIDEISEDKESFKKLIKKSNRKAQLPALVHIDFDEISKGGIYKWNDIKMLLRKETGFVFPESTKGLHTSCKIERVKAYSQYMKFRNMESTMIPFSALEISLAVNSEAISKEEAIKELKESSGFTLERPDEYKYIEKYLGINQNK